MKRKLSVAVLSVAAALLISLTACSPSNNASNTQNPPAASDTNSVETDKISGDANQSNTATKSNGDTSSQDGGSKALTICFDYAENVDATGLDADAVSSASLREAATQNNTKKTPFIVDEIKTLKNTDVFSIQVNEPYSANYDEMVGVARQDIADKKSFTFKSELANLADYKDVYFVLPIWWSELPQPVEVFMEQYDFSGKNIIPIVVHRGSGFGRVVSQMQELEPNATFSEGLTVNADIDNSKAKEEVDNFLK